MMNDDGGDKNSQFLEDVVSEFEWPARASFNIWHIRRFLLMIASKINGNTGWELTGHAFHAQSFEGAREQRQYIINVQDGSQN